MSDSEFIIKLRRYARKRRVFILKCDGVTDDNFQDAKRLVDEFKRLAIKSDQNMLGTKDNCAETGIELMMFWVKRSYMSFNEIESYLGEIDLDNI